MSRVAKKEIAIPSGVQYDYTDGIITISNGNKVLKQSLHPEVEIVKTDSGLSFKPADTSGRVHWAMAGTTRALVANMVKGVTEGFKIDLQLVGVGYRAKMDGRKVVFTLGKSHPDVFMLPEGIEISIEKDVNITLKSIDKQLLGQVAANMMALRKPDAYKGKGVRMVGKVLKLKEVKKK
tara:strand:+ start:531 stop:1067 length:537 start_codon:yes stop_codon:yes gene_type:complete